MFTYSDYESDFAKASKITESIYQGNMMAASNEKALKELGITHILVAGNFLEKCFPDKFTYIQFEGDDLDYVDLYKYFKEGYEFIDNCIIKGGKILIHCAAGISRSSTFTCCYLMKKNGITFEEAYKIVQSGRSIACPNYGFQKQLKEWYEVEVKPNLIKQES
mmetsp:Transcript_16476/g.17131  ORF Transcript_16476/g.17131 Transcript_16476/m.17131 type:complete len:163 (+) Transcript_16476:3-491(+)